MLKLTITHLSSKKSILAQLKVPFLALCTVLVSALSVLTNLSNCADKNFVLAWSKVKDNTSLLMLNQLISITIRLKDCGLNVNEKKTDYTQMKK